MIAELECIPCLVRQAREMAVMTAEDDSERMRIVRKCLAFMSETDLKKSPPEIMQGIGELITKSTGVEDPYSDIKTIHTEKALAMLPEMDRIVDEAENRFEAGLRLAIAGNIIDLGARTEVADEDITNTLHEAIHEPLVGTRPGILEEQVRKAHRILYLADNAGESVFDRKFLQQFPGNRTTVAVRGAPALNDATLEDAKRAGLHEVARLISNGSGAPATVLSDCSPEFVSEFEKADVIIAKGQGNYESLSGTKANIFFLFRVKCSLVANHSGFPEGSLVILRAGE